MAAIPEGTRLVQITGGEPLLQAAAVAQLCEALLDAGKAVLLETGGHRPLSAIPEGVHIVMDIKLPASGEAGHDFAANLEYLKPGDEVKFVVADEGDFRAALEWVERYELERFDLLFSAVWGAVEPLKLAEWVLASGLWGRMQLQQHKYIWGPGARGV